MAETVPAARRVTAHDHRQVTDALGWSVVQVDKAVALGVLPPQAPATSAARRLQTGQAGRPA